MTVREFLSRANDLQQRRGFKIAASGVVVLIAMAAFIAYVVARHAPAGEGAPADAPSAVAQPDAPTPPVTEADAATAAAEKNAVEATQRILKTITAGRQDPTSLGIGLLVGVGLALVVIWLGLGLSYLALLLLGVLPALLVWRGLGWPGAALLLAGVTILAAAFSALLRALRLAFAGPHPVMAIARNLLDEASRQKLSLVFIVLLMFGLAALPGMLDPTQPLRYRVQTFLQYSTAGSFWLIAILVLLLSVASVAFEQRDRLIWQTMTKPVSAWQYLLGKWLGLAGLSGVLLVVCASGVFLFTEYLRSRPALGEDPNQAYVALDGGISEDRQILETQVLAARRTVRPEEPPIDAEQFEKNVAALVEEEMRRGELNFAELSPADAAAERERIRLKLSGEVFKGVRQAYFAIEPTKAEVFVFRGLGPARGSDRPIVLRYKVDAGANNPDDFYKVTFEFRGGEATVEEVNLGQMHYLHLLPTVVDDDGVVAIRVTNGDLFQRRPNAETLAFPPDGLEVTYAVSGYRPNFARVFGVLWVKLAFLAMLGLASATFLSFAVASMVSFGAFLAAESAGFLRSSLENYTAVDPIKGHTEYGRLVIRSIAQAVEWIFRVYADLSPVSKITDGRLLGWGEVGVGTVVLAIWTAVLFAGGVLIFRRRELATYSGQ